MVLESCKNLCSGNKGIHCPKDAKPMSPTTKKAMIISAVAAAVILGGILAIIGTGGFSHFAEVTKSALACHTPAWVAAVTGAGALITGAVIAGLCTHKCAKKPEVKKENLVETD